jgi:hypothetical protein
VGQQPVGMRAGDAGVVGAVPEAYRRADAGQVEAPGADQRDVVIDPAIEAAKEPDARPIRKGRIDKPVEAVASTGLSSGAPDLMGGSAISSEAAAGTGPAWTAGRAPRSGAATESSPTT